MPHDRLHQALAAHMDALERQGTAKGEEFVVCEVVRPQGDLGPRVRIEGYGDRAFLRFNSNSYLGLGLDPDVIAAEEIGSHTYGAGPGAVRFISGAYTPHRELEAALARFHGREDAMLFSSAYATVLGTIVPLITPETIVISDALNHNCIINAMRLARPADKAVYPHLDLGALDEALAAARGKAQRVLVVTDGIFSMRGDHAPLDAIAGIVEKHDPHFPENVVLVVDDSHGVGAFGLTGRGTEEYTASPPSDVLIGTLGKAFGVNGGYVTGSRTLIRFLREAAPTYIYSNPITPGEALACLKALEIVDSPRGVALLARLRHLTRTFEAGLARLGIETIPGEHPVVPLMIRDTQRTRALVKHLFEQNILVTGLTYPVVPQGDEEIRTQINADHTEKDLDILLGALAAFEA